MKHQIQAKRKTDTTTRQQNTPGANAASIAPPSYGMDFLDSQAKLPNRTGLPDNLKSGIENLSGLSMDSVRVHYNSGRPAQLNALAYTQGTDIHVAPGQEQHLPHEAWHVVQQAQGRVKPTMQMKEGLAVNDDKGLEHEADVMGSKALQTSTASTTIHSTQPGNQSTIQKKNRIDLSKVDEKKKEDIQKKIEELKNKKRQEKTEKTGIWAKSTAGKDDTRDELYNSEIAKIRKDYEEAIIKLATEQDIKDTLVSGNDYYGKEVEEKGVKFYRRENDGKEYVKDIRGTFVPRYIRRELNHKDDLSSGITTQGINTLEALKTGKQIGPGGNVSLSWEQREFLQQSNGGGSNLFALSHTSTKRPILSNAHDSFGQKPDKYNHSGAIITDLTKMGNKKFAAQWTIDPITGHKIPLPENVHTTLDKAGEKEKKGWTGADRDKTVRMSGYRNMEIVAEGVSKEAIIQPDESWKTAEGLKTDYNSGKSKRGQSMAEFKKQKQQEVLKKLEEERKKKLVEEQKKKLEEEQKKELKEPKKKNNRSKKGREKKRNELYG